jgi:hypothetical protein
VCFCAVHEELPNGVRPGHFRRVKVRSER